MGRFTMIRDHFTWTRTGSQRPIRRLEYFLMLRKLAY